MHVLGISCFFHDSAAALVSDGEVVAAVQEERLSREPGAPHFPKRAINHCLQTAGITIEEVDHAVFHEKPFLKFARVVQSHVRAWPRGYRQTLSTFPSWLEDRLVPSFVLERETGASCPTHFVKHHHSHAATAFFLSPFDEAAVLTVDGVGEMATAAWGRGSGTSVRIDRELRYPHSLGLMYSAVAEYLGFARHSGEDCVAALAPRGQPTLLDRLRSLVAPRDDGGFRLDERWFSFATGPPLYGPRFVHEMGPPRRPDQALEQRHLDLAASMQALLEERMVAMARQVRASTGLERLCLGGGVAQNAACVSRIVEDSGFREVFVPPAPGNDGSAVGAALAVACANGAPRPGAGSAFLGPAVPLAHTKRLLTNSRLPFTEMPADEKAARAASIIARDGVVGWVQGRLEMARRPLGSRAFLFDPRRRDRVEQLAHNLSQTEAHPNLGVLVRQEQCADWFEPGCSSPYQMMAPRVHVHKRPPLEGVTRPDGRAHVQTVAREHSPLLWQLLDALEKEGGVPLLGIVPMQDGASPLACAPEDVVAMCRKSGVARLIIETLMIDLPTVLPSPTAG